MGNHLEYRLGHQNPIYTAIDAICHDHLGILGILSPDESEILPAALNGSLWILFQETVDLLQFPLCQFVVFCQFHTTLHADQFFVGLWVKIHEKPPRPSSAPMSYSKILYSGTAD